MAYPESHGRNVGGDLNAYTNKEETVCSPLLKEHLVVELLTDIVLDFSRTGNNQGVEVIIDEIQSYEDHPR